MSAMTREETEALIQEVLAWYQEQHPIWFRWLHST